MRSIWAFVAIVAILILAAPRARAASVAAKAPGARRRERTLAAAPAGAPVLCVAPPRTIRLIRLVKPKKPKRAISLAPTSSRWLKPTDEVATASALQQRLRRARQRASRSRLAQSGPGADPVPPPATHRPARVTT